MTVLKKKGFRMLHRIVFAAFASRFRVSVATLIPVIALSACVVDGMTQPAAYTESRTPAPQGPIERKYREHGPWDKVATLVSTTACDRENNLCDIWYPAELGRNPVTGQGDGFRHPVIVWANGSGQPSTKYAFYLQHLASWGFVVIAPRDKATGTGDTTLDAAYYILQRGASAGDVFFNRIDAANVGASGHSQGGSSILKLASEDSGPFKTFVPIHAVPGGFSLLCCKFRMETLAGTQADKAILYLGGTGDKGNDRENRSAYDITAQRTTKAIGLFNGSRHDDILGSPGCLPNTPCMFGSDVYTGYATAWFMWHLQGAQDARTAFRQSGEFVASDSAWHLTASNIQ